MSPNDGLQDKEHFLLLFHWYNWHKSDLLNSVNAILLPHGSPSCSNEVLLKFILYCDERLSINVNKKLQYVMQPSSSFMLKDTLPTVVSLHFSIFIECCAYLCIGHGVVIVFAPHCVIPIV